MSLTLLIIGLYFICTVIWKLIDHADQQAFVDQNADRFSDEG